MAYVSFSGVAIINPFKVAGFESKERLRSSEIKEDGLCFRWIWKLKVNVAINPFKVAGFESFRFGYPIDLVIIELT